MVKTNEVSLYFHIPFCTRKCPYCHFYVVQDLAEHKELLSEAFSLEWAKSLELLAGKKIVSIYFGGGTPSLFGPQLIEKILVQALKLPHADDCEITLEVNPENSSFELMKAYRDIGINRLSLGVQSLDDPLLKLLGRTHDASIAIEAIHSIHRAGFENLSIDLMYEIPSQTLDSWHYTLQQLKALPITHLSLYNLTIEPETVFFKKKDQLIPKLPSAESSLQMLNCAVEQLASQGLNRYEISAFCKEGFSSRHNTGYWTGRPFLGFGPSAFSYYAGQRFRNVPHLKKYASLLQQGLSTIDFEEKLPFPRNQKELLAVELRLLKGVHLPSFQENYGRLSPDIQETIEALKNQGWLKEKDNTLALSEEGLLFYDSVAEAII